MTKYERYQDYVISNGNFIGEFEQMYRDHDDPWEQSIRETYASEKAVALNVIKALKPATVLELGCGFGCFTNRIKDVGVENVVGVDISVTAIKKARALTPECIFEVGDILNFEIYKKYKPDIIVMAEITWYVLEKLRPFLSFVREEMPDTYLIHLLNTYPKGEQKYGSDYFNDLPGILEYFNMNYAEFGEIQKSQHGNCRRTYFIGRYSKLPELPI
jgi:SAM-dependent methyltransferase